MTNTRRSDTTAATCAAWHGGVTGFGRRDTRGVAFDLRLIEAMVVLAEELHFGRAAERLNVSQPTLSQQVRRLEDQLGVRLLARTTRTVALTSAGAAFVAYGSVALVHARRAEQAARTAGSARTLLRVAASADVEELVGPLLERFSRTQSDFEVRFLPGTDEAALASVTEGRVDAALVWSAPPSLPGLSSMRVFEPEAGVVVPVGDALAEPDELTADDIRDRELVLFPRAVAEAHYDLLLAQLGGGDGRAVRHVAVTGSAVQSALIKSVAEEGGCAPVTREHLSRVAPSHVTFRPFSPPLQGPVCLVWRNPATGPALALVAFAEAHLLTAS